MDQKKRRFVDNDIFVGLINDIEMEQWRDGVMK